MFTLSPSSGEYQVKRGVRRNRHLGVATQPSSLPMQRGSGVILSRNAEVAELADAPALGAGGRKAVGVRVPSSAPSTTPKRGPSQPVASRRSRTAGAPFASNLLFRITHRPPARLSPRRWDSDSARQIARRNGPMDRAAALRPASRPRAGFSGTESQAPRRKEW